LGAFQLCKTKPQAMAWGFVLLRNCDNNRSVSYINGFSDRSVRVRDSPQPVAIHGLAQSCSVCFYGPYALRLLCTANWLIGVRARRRVDMNQRDVDLSEFRAKDGKFGQVTDVDSEVIFVQIPHVGRGRCTSRGGIHPCLGCFIKVIQQQCFLHQSDDVGVSVVNPHGHWLIKRKVVE